MNQEFETKILNINKKELEKKLVSIGAKKKSEFLMRRWVFDFMEKDPDKISEWIRLRDEGNKTTITYKKRFSDKSNNTNEIEVEVADFDTTAEILKNIPFKRKFYQENKRTIYVLEKIEFMIDEWPGLEPHLEIEGKTKIDMEKGIELLGMKGKESGDISVIELYAKKGINLHNIPELRFENFK